MSHLKEAVVNYIRKANAHSKAANYEKKKREEKARALDAVVQLIPNGRSKVMSLDGKMVLIQNRGGAMIFEPVEYLND